MRVLLVSKFLHAAGGVETYLRWQASALAELGHEVALLGMTPPPGDVLMPFPSTAPVYLTPYRSFDRGDAARIHSAAASIYSPRVGAVFREAVDEFEPDAIHFHTTCYHLTPAVFREAKRSGARIFLTAHEYKLVCANHSLFDDRRGALCTACVGRGVGSKSATVLLHRCIKGAPGPTVIGALEMPLATWLWRSCRGKILVPSRFFEAILRDDGVSDDAMEYLENPWPEIAIDQEGPRDSVLYMARLTSLKGIKTALHAWRFIANDLPDVRLRIAGRGPEEGWIREFVARSATPRVDVLGMLDPDEIQRELSRALVTVHPSRCHDNSPLSVRESLCAGVPAAVSDRGGSAELVGGDLGPVLDADDIAGWAAALSAAARDGLAASDRLLNAVRARRYGAAEHLTRLVELYAGSP